MQQQRNIQHFAVHAFFKDGGYQWQVFDQFAAFDLGKVGDALDRVFVHGVGVIHIELHHRDDVFKFGDERPKHTQLIHPAQGPFWVAVFEH